MDAANTLPRLLIIDDDPMDIDILRSILESDYRLTIAIDGKTGLKRAHATPPPDLILLDVMMPEMDGFELCERLKDDPELSEIPVIFVTAKDKPTDETKGFNMGAVDYIAKPFNTPVVLARVKTHLALRSARMRLEQQNHLLLYERGVVEGVLDKMRQSAHFDNTGLRFLFSPLEKASGDIILSACRPDGGQHILLGDFTGHGLSAAIGGPIVAEIFYSRTQAGDTLDLILTKINETLCEKLPVDMFMAGCLVALSPSRREATVWNCTMPDIILFRQGKAHQKIPSAHRPVGILMMPYHAGTPLTSLTASDRITLYSDGIDECANPQGEMFGSGRVETLLAEILASDKNLEEIHTILQDFRGDAKQKDDITLVEISLA